MSCKVAMQILGWRSVTRDHSDPKSVSPVSQISSWEFKVKPMVNSPEKKKAGYFLGGVFFRGSTVNSHEIMVQWKIAVFER